ncbi:MAG: reverse transcriptase domain-containing protein [Phycicoccus sp.]
MATVVTSIGLDALRGAWGRVLAADAEDDRLGRGVAKFERDLDNQLGSLAAELAWDGYQPGPLFEVKIPKGGGADDGGFRVLHIPPVRDRVVERAVLDAIMPLVDPVLGPWSYAYRSGLGVNHAIAALVDLRDAGASHVVRADIDDCFPSIPQRLAIRLVAALVSDVGLVGLIEQFVRRGFRREGSSRVYAVGGLAQGCALSPLLANLVLAGVDEDLVDAGFQPVRYADDIAIAAEGADEAREALRVLTDALEALDMSLGTEAAVMSFDEGFTFLGEDFGPRYPPKQTAGVIEPERRSLYLGLQGSRVRTQAGRLVVESADDADLIDVPSSRVSRIVCFGSIGVSAGMRSFALEDGVDVVFASRRGSYQGHLAGGA